ncbi:MAG TPA: LytTR family DNA-binding domain-containing protein [Dinghuibacter sp.]|jgi:two-component system LytT family response regulator|uniref:LytR/AlgR family response regulator transcription factor n=1 Tax=Dinghuibacter sp. TaxID=2024697 RepID=UPI002D188842|nr:LytTR family DNA-binding domain-containing protein [Dinghuibacter sp.]HTJ13118.1 LytTR family DNA-binding domain-containing protein [Dinghuibacter sp.]
MILKAVLIDDEPGNIDNLRVLLEEYCPEVTVVGATTDAEKGRALVGGVRPDLVFLDIQMPGMNGFELLQSLDRIDFEVVFVTAFDQYGIQAVKFSALDYLVKPIKIAELQAAVDKAMSRRQQKTQNGHLENLLRLLKAQQKDEHRIALPGLRETRFVRPGEVVRCESSNSYTTFHLRTGEKLTVSRPIYEYEGLLGDYGFVRCQQSHLVNTRYIQSWVKDDGGYLLLEDGARIPVSKDKRDAVRAALNGP